MKRKINVFFVVRACVITVARSRNERYYHGCQLRLWVVVIPVRVHQCIIGRAGKMHTYIRLSVTFIRVGVPRRSRRKTYVRVHTYLLRGSEREGTNTLTIFSLGIRQG